MPEITLTDLPTITTRAYDNTLPNFFQKTIDRVGTSLSGAIDGVTEWWTSPAAPVVGINPATGAPIYGDYGNPWGDLQPGNFPERISPLGSLIQSILPDWMYPPMSTGATVQPVAWRTGAGGLLDRPVIGGLTIGNIALLGAVAAVGFLAFKKLS